MRGEGTLRLYGPVRGQGHQAIFWTESRASPPLLTRCGIRDVVTCCPPSWRWGVVCKSLLSALIAILDNHEIRRNQPQAKLSTACIGKTTFDVGTPIHRGLFAYDTHFSPLEALSNPLEAHSDIEKTFIVRTIQSPNFFKATWRQKLCFFRPKIKIATKLFQPHCSINPHQLGKLIAHPTLYQPWARRLI